VKFGWFRRVAVGDGGSGGKGCVPSLNVMGQVMRRGFVLTVGFAVAGVGAFVVLDRYGGSDRFADLPGRADVRLVGSFSPRQLARLAALPQAAAAECDTTLYGVTIITPRVTLRESTVLTALRSPALRRTTVSTGGYPGTDTELLVDAQTAAAQGIRVGDRVSLARGPHTVSATVVGIARRPAGEVGQSEAVALLPAGAIAKLGGGVPCGEVTVQLKRRSEATAFQRAAKDVLGKTPAVTYDDSMRGHV